MKLIGHNGREIHIRKTVAHHSHEEGSYNLLEVAFIERVGDNNLVTSWVTGGRRDPRSSTLPTADEAAGESKVDAPATDTDVDADAAVAAYVASKTAEVSASKPAARRFGFF